MIYDEVNCWATTLHALDASIPAAHPGQAVTDPGAVHAGSPRVRAELAWLADRGYADAVSAIRTPAGNEHLDR
jgi:hypothetical protein